MTVGFMLTGAGTVYGDPRNEMPRNEPLSAIGWLSDATREPSAVATKIYGMKRNGQWVPGGAAEGAQANAPFRDDITKSGVPIGVTMTTLSGPRRDAVGLLPQRVTGLPRDFWGKSSSTALSRELEGISADLPAPLSELLRLVLLAELDPPVDSGTSDVLLLARIDSFVRMGALDQVRELINRAGPTTQRLFRRWFDVSLLGRNEEDACKRMLGNPSLAPGYPARIFCLARSGDWGAAALTLNSAQSLGVISDRDDALLARFLDPDLFEGEPPLPLPEQITPLRFRMHEAIGEPLDISALPNAFAYAALSETEGWKPRLLAAERLARSGAILPRRLFAVYSERHRAASGGVWDRVEAVQQLAAALEVSDVAQIEEVLPKAADLMSKVGLEHALAQLFGEQLIDVPLKAEAAKIAARLGLLSMAYERAALSEQAEMPLLWRAIARGDQAGMAKAAQNKFFDPFEDAVARAFTDQQIPVTFEPLLARGNRGLAVLKAIKMLEDGAGAPPTDVEEGLRLLRLLGFEDTARQMGLYILITRRGA